MKLDSRYTSSPPRGPAWELTQRLQQRAWVHYSRGRNTYDNTPEQRHATSFTEFAKAILADRGQQKGQQYIASAFKPDESGTARRRKDGAQPTAFVAFDFDGFSDAEAWHATVEALQAYQGIAYTTASHTPEKPRARAVLAVTRPMDRPERQRVSLALEARLAAEVGAGCITFDQSVYRPEQPLFLPLVNAGSYEFHGEPVDVDAMLAEAPPIKEAPNVAERAETAAANDPVLAELYRRGMVKREVEPGKFAVVCPCAEEHTGKSNETSTVYMLPNFNGVRYGKIHCLHDHCTARPQPDFLAALGLDPRTVWAKQRGEDPRPAAAPEPDSGLSSVFTLASLDQEDFPPVSWVVPSILPEGLTLFAGKPKMGKSWLAMGIGIAVSLGGYALGKLPVQAGSVLYLALEDNKRRLKRRGAKLMGGAPLPANFHAATGWPRLNEGGADNLRTFLDAHPDTRLVMVDTLQKVRPEAKSGTSPYKDDYEAAQALLAIASEYQIAILLIHHLRKSISEGDVMDEISGSTGLTGGVDGLMVIKRDRGKADAVLHIDGRDIEEPAELALQFDNMTAQWVLQGNADEVRRDESRQAVVDALRTFGELTATELASELDMDIQNVRKQLQRMVRDNEVRVTGKNGRAHVYELHPSLPPVSVVPVVLDNTPTRTTKTTRTPKTDKTSKTDIHIDSLTPFRYRLADTGQSATAYLNATDNTAALSELERQYGPGRVSHVEAVRL